MLSAPTETAVDACDGATPFVMLFAEHRGDTREQFGVITHIGPNEGSIRNTAGPPGASIPPPCEATLALKRPAGNVLTSHRGLSGGADYGCGRAEATPGVLRSDGGPAAGRGLVRL